MPKRNIFAAEWFVYDWDEATVLGDVQRVFLRGEKRERAKVPHGIDPCAVMVAGDAPAKPFAWMQPIEELPGELHLLMTDDALLDEILGAAGIQGALGDMDPEQRSQPMTFPPRPLVPRQSAVFDDRALAGRPLEPFEQAAIAFVVSALGAAAVIVWAIWHYGRHAV